MILSFNSTSKYIKYTEKKFSKMVLKMFPYKHYFHVSIISVDEFVLI